MLLGGIVVLSALEVRGVLSVSLVLVLFGWPAMVRLQRASVLQITRPRPRHWPPARSARPRPRAAAARAAGALRPLLAYASAYAGLVIGVEATLTYVGVGLQQPILSWGLSAAAGADPAADQAPHLLLPAGLLLLAVGSLVVLGQALQRGARDRAA